MVDVPLGGSARKLISSLPLLVQPRRRGDRPPPSRCCGAPSWWNGWRDTFPIVATAVAGSVERWQLSLPLGKCSSCHGGFTCYPPGVYPRRQYQLDVVAEAVAAVVVGDEPVERAATSYASSATSTRRWSAWVASLADVGELHVATAQVDASIATVAAIAPTALRTKAAAVLAAFEGLGAALARVGLTMVERTGLGRVLGWQHRRHGDVYGLVAGPTRFSPAMAPGGRPSSR